MNAQKTTTFIQDNKTTILIVIIILLSLALVYSLVSPTQNISTLFKAMTPSPTPKVFPTLDKNLTMIVNSNTPQETAKMQHVALQGQQVQALITLKDNSFFFTEIYGKQLLRYGKFIQALIKFDKLEELAKNPKIESIKSTPDASNIPAGVNLTPPTKK